MVVSIAVDDSQVVVDVLHNCNVTKLERVVQLVKQRKSLVHVFFTFRKLFSVHTPIRKRNKRKTSLQNFAS